MSSRWIRALGGFLAGVLLVGALIYLQVLNSEKDLLSCLSAYLLISVATLVALVALRSQTSADPLCLSTSAAFITYIVIRALSSPSVYHARADLYLALASVLLYGLAVSTLSTAWRRMWFLGALVGFGVVHVVVSSVQAGWGENYSMLISSLEGIEPSNRGTGFYVDPDHLAGLLEILGILGLSLACWSRWPKWSKVVMAYLTAICYLGLAQTGSRGGYLSAAASLLIFALLSLLVLRAGGRGLLVKYGASSLAILMVALAALWFFIQQHKALTTAVHNIVTVDQGRLDLWSAAVSQWKIQPWIGTGSGTYLFYGREFRTERMQLDPVDVHNDYLHLLCEYGIIGAAAFLLFFFAHLRNGVRTFLRIGPGRVAAGSRLCSDRLALDIGALSVLGAYVVHSFVDFNMHIPANALLLAFIFGIVANPGLERPDHTKPSVLEVWPRVLVTAVAIVLFVQCLRLLPGEYYAEVARLGLRDEKPLQAISAAEEALRHEQHNPNIFSYLGRASLALAHQEDHASERLPLSERALKAFDQARRLAPLEEAYPLEMALVFDELARFNEAEAMFELARSRDPRSETIAQMYQAHRDAWENAKHETSAPD